MGWWSATIMGGDTPLDIEIVLYEAAGISSDEIYDDENISPETINARVAVGLPKMIKAAKSEKNHRYYGESELFYQVLGVLVMRHGVPVKDAKPAIKMALAGAKEDEWAESGDTERQGFVNAFIKQLKEYDGIPQEPAHEGLFQKIEEAIASGKEGLVNK